MSTILSGEVIYSSNSGKIQVIKNEAKRSCSCVLCGGTISSGEERLVTITPNYKNGKTMHNKCINRLWSESMNTISYGSEYDSNNTIMHTMEIIAPKEAIYYFLSVGFKAVKYSPTHRRYILADEVNAYRSGHVITTALNENYRIFVNGQEVKSHEEFDGLTKKYH